jgi:hypothetical protein
MPVNINCKNKFYTLVSLIESFFYKPSEIYKLIFMQHLNLLNKAAAGEFQVLSDSKQETV